VIGRINIIERQTGSSKGAVPRDSCARPDFATGPCNADEL